MRQACLYVWRAASTRPFNFFTIVISALAAGFAFWSAYVADKAAKSADQSTTQQLEQGKAQLKELRKYVKAATKSALYAGDLAKAARDNLETEKQTAALSKTALQNSADAFRIEHRPWLVVTSAVLTSGGIELTAVVLRLENIGRSPAYGTFDRSHLETGYYKYNYSVEELKRMSPDGPMPTLFVEREPHSIGIDIEGSMLDQPPILPDKTASIFVTVPAVTTWTGPPHDDLTRTVGVLTYTDANSFPYHASFCYDLTPPHPPIPGSPTLCESPNSNVSQ